MMIRRGKLAILGLLLGGTVLITCPIAVQADCAMAHTHIGVNPTWRPADWSRPAEGSVDPDPTDDDKLWFFSLPPVHASATPGWPHWEQTNGTTFLVLSPVLDLHHVPLHQGQQLRRPKRPGAPGRHSAHGKGHGI